MRPDSSYKLNAFRSGQFWTYGTLNDGATKVAILPQGVSMTRRSVVAAPALTHMAAAGFLRSSDPTMSEQVASPRVEDAQPPKYIKARV